MQTSFANKQVNAYGRKVQGASTFRAGPASRRAIVVQAVIASPRGIKAPQWDGRVEDIDPEMFNLLSKEKHRQAHGLELIASENFTSKAVMQMLGSAMTNKYSEGRPGARYYGGNEYIDQVELLCEKRALELYKLDPKEWGVNVQPLSGSPANFAVYTALLKPHDRLMGMALQDGGHLTHGFRTPKKEVSASSVYFNSLSYGLDAKTCLIDYDHLEANAKIFMPKLIVAGASAYSRAIDYKRMRQICDKNGSYLMTDMAHISGMVATGVLPGPWDHSHVVTTTTHKSMRGPRGGMIFYRKDLKEKIDWAVFPGLQGGPHNHTIAALAVALKQANSPEFVQYQNQVVKNAKALCSRLQQLGYKILTDGTDNHLLLVDLKPNGIDGARLQNVVDEVSITLNKNSVPGDTSAMVPGGIRLGTCAMTTRGMTEADFVNVADLLHRAVNIALNIKAKLPADHKTKDFLEHVEKEGKGRADVLALKREVEEWGSSFPMPGL